VRLPADTRPVRRLIYEFHEVELIDGTVDVAPVGLGFEAINDYGLRRVRTRQAPEEPRRPRLQLLPLWRRVRGTIDYLWGSYDPSFYTDLDGQRVNSWPAPG